MIDLRSDTVTRPTRAMREAMTLAEVGDDVFDEDPTTRALEAEVARLLGKEAALFVSSGTMGNQLAIALHTRPGDEVIVGEGAHPVWYESGAAAVLSGVQFATAGQGGMFDADQMEEQIKPDAYYYPRTSLVCIENTHNRGGGRSGRRRRWWRWESGSRRAVSPSTSTARACGTRASPPGATCATSRDPSTR